MPRSFMLLDNFRQALLRLIEISFDDDLRSTKCTEDALSLTRWASYF